jgi:dimethylargininase
MHFQQAIVRPPGKTFVQGITSAGLGAPLLSLALEQHQYYCDALESCGLSVKVLEADVQFPDSTFVEDTAVITRKCAVLTRPGAETRQGEVAGIKSILAQYKMQLDSIQPPGTLDGGDICQVEDHFFIGISERTNADGAQQLASILNRNGFTSSFVYLGRINHLLHLKSGMAYMGDGRLVLTKDLLDLSNFQDFEIIQVDEHESYAANCLRVNDFVLVAAGFPKIMAELSSLGYKTIPLEVSEFQKMDGGLSCLSLRF